MAKQILKGNADAVEFCPHSIHSGLLATATYTLIEDQRIGGITLFEVVEDDFVLKEVDSVDTPGVFDIRWRPPSKGADPLLAQACSDGSVRIYSLQENSLIENAREKITDSMCLFLEWDPFGENRMVVSHSNGSVSEIMVNRGSIELEQNWEAHDYEVWTATYDLWKQRLVYTGGDDSGFVGWDVRNSTDSPAFKDMKSHGMGVCCIQSSPHVENIVATGSYDENLRIWDLRTMKKPLMKQKLGVGGGVWKFKWHPSQANLVAAACMHNGFSIVSIDGDELKVLEEYKEHESLGYGVDWSKGVLENVVASCSFYDKSLHIWLPSFLNEIPS